MTPSDIPIEASSDDVAQWLDLVCRRHGASSRPSNFRSLEQGFRIYDIIEKYGSECLRFTWRQTMQNTWQLGGDRHNCGIEVFIWACNHGEEEWAREALRHFKGKVSFSDSRSACPRRHANQTLNNKIPLAAYSTLLELCAAYRRDTAFCDPCRATGQQTQTCSNCGGTGYLTIWDGCDWDKVADAFRL